MSTTSVDLLKTYLEDAVAAELSIESQYRTFASECDDDEEVKAVFAAHADQSRRQHQRLTQRLGQLGGSPSTGKSVLARLFSATPRIAQIGHLKEEQIAQNLMAAYTIESGEQAMYHALIVVSEAAGDVATASLAREIQAEETETAGKVWHFLPTRAKVAFNMLTVEEVDPSVVTKAADNRLL